MHAVPALIVNTSSPVGTLDPLADGVLGEFARISECAAC